MQNVVNEEGVIKYSDFKDFVINLKIERMYFIAIKLCELSTKFNHKSLVNQMQMQSNYPQIMAQNYLQLIYQRSKR